MSPTDVVDDFLAFHGTYNRISDARIADMRRVLRAFVAEQPALDQITARDLEMFLAERDLAPSTTLKYLKMIRPFVKWCARHGLMSAEQVLNLGEVSAPRGAAGGKPKPYSRTEIAKFWEYFDQTFPWTTDEDEAKQTPSRAEMFTRRWQRGASSWAKVWPYARRLQAEAIVALALFGGLRRDEIYRLTIERAFYDNQYINVSGAAKNEQGEHIDRAVPMVRPLRAALANWIEFRAQVLQPEHDELWLSLWREQKLEPMSFDVLAHLMDKVGPGYSLHRFRHTYATERLRARMAIEDLQAIMGHTSIAMTLRYAKIGAEDVVERSALTEELFAAPLERSHPILLPDGLAA